MSKQSNTSSKDQVWRIQGLHQRSTNTSAGTAHQRLPSFLSLTEAINGYPDTRESGDTYDIEANVDR